MIEMNFTESFIKQQVKCLDILTELIAYDKQHGEPPENTRVLEAFIDTQRRALDLAGKLLEKHKPALEEAAKAEREKREAESKIKAAETATLPFCAVKSTCPPNASAFCVVLPLV